MKLSELSGAHIGRQVTITTTYATVTGVLYSVGASARRIADDAISGRPRISLGRIGVDVQVGAFEACDLDGLFDCEVHEK